MHLHPAHQNSLDSLDSCWQLIEGALGPGCHIWLNVHATFKEDMKEPQYWAAKFLRVGAPFKGDALPRTLSLASLPARALPRAHTLPLSLPSLSLLRAPLARSLYALSRSS